MSEVSSHAPYVLVDIDTCPLFGVCNEDDVQLRNLMNEFFVQNDNNSWKIETVYKFTSKIGYETLGFAYIFSILGTH